MTDEQTKKSVNGFIYKNAYEHADKILELIHPTIRQALMEAYAKGFNEAAQLAMKHTNKH